MTRGANRVRALAGAALGSLRRRTLRARPPHPAKILVLHELLLGDTLMLAPLLAALRQRYPAAEIFVTAQPGYATLFSGKPYGVRVLPYSERNPRALTMLDAARGCDIAILPGENRQAIVARALGAKWIVAFAAGRPAWKNRAADELIAFPAEPATLGDMFASLAGHAAPLRYTASDWPAPTYAPFDTPSSAAYVVLHVGAGSPLRLWTEQSWRSLADALAARGLQVIWSAGPQEAGLVRSIDPHGRFRSYAGNLDLAQLWHLLTGAAAAVTLDTGIAHLAKLIRTPTVALFGPGSAVLFGKGRFWRDNCFRAVTSADVPCRDQRHLFRRELEWVRRCNRTLVHCPRARCMEAITPEQVLASLALVMAPGALQVAPGALQVE